LPETPRVLAVCIGLKPWPSERTGMRIVDTTPPKLVYDRTLPLAEQDKQVLDGCAYHLLNEAGIESSAENVQALVGLLRGSPQELTPKMTGGGAL
jgi:hypothetical protein